MYFGSAVTSAPRREAPVSFSGKHITLRQGGGKGHAGPLPLTWALLVAPPASQKGSKSSFLMHMH